jgi:hypothetical protein
MLPAKERMNRSSGWQQIQLSWPGLTRPSMIKRRDFSVLMDGRVKPGHDNQQNALPMDKGVEP